MTADSPTICLHDWRLLDVQDGVEIYYCELCHKYIAEPEGARTSPYPR